MRFKRPEKIEDLTLEEISKLHEESLAEATELNAIADDEITDEQVADLIALADIVAELETVRDGLVATEEQRAEALAAARNRVTEASNVDDPEDEGGEQAGEPDTEETDKPQEVPSGEPVSVSAAAKPRSFASKAASKSKAVDPPADPEPEPSKALSIVASANVAGFNSGQEIANLDELAKAYLNRTKSFASGNTGGSKTLNPNYRGHQLSTDAQRFGVAQLVKPTNPFHIAEKMSAEDQFSLIKEAANEKRLGNGSLVAAGGWCAPSEQIWGFLELESTDALLSIPEITSDRGGISFTPGPQLGTLLTEANLGFNQTEAQAIAGTVKPIYDIVCPTWQEVRMNAVGYALRAGLLTQAAFPELIRRYLGLALIVHARRLNTLTINAIQTAAGSTVTFAPVKGAEGLPSSSADLLGAIELRALQLRQQYSMAVNASVEGIFPIWAKAVVRADLSRRGDRDLISVSDQEINAWFSQRGVNAQFVYDYQNINNGALGTPGGTGTWTALPTTIDFLLYPAGSFVRLGTPVIDLDTVYDVDNLTKNQFLAAFFEEGFAVANTGGGALRTTVGLPNLFGSTGVRGVGADATQVTA